MAVVWILKIVLVVALLCAAGAVSTPKGRLPLALRGVRKIVRQDRGVVAPDHAVDGERVSAGRKTLSFILVIAAVVVAVV